MLVRVATPPAVATDKQVRAAQVAHVLAQATRNDEVSAADVLRILRHELRRLNTGNKLKVPTRSVEAQAVIDRCTAAGEKVPNNNSDDALHADHVWPITERHLKEGRRHRVPVRAQATAPLLPQTSGACSARRGALSRLA
jgi:hypothetical protein